MIIPKPLIHTILVEKFLQPEVAVVATLQTILESGETSPISWNPAVSVLVSPSANCARSFSPCVPNAHDQPMDGPFS